MHRNNQQIGRDNDHTLLVHMATCDCLTMRQACLLIYGKADNVAKVQVQRKLTKLMKDRLVDRTESGTGEYRYFLTERGCKNVELFLSFKPAAGHDRSYLNAKRNDAVLEAAIMYMRSSQGVMVLGKGALRARAIAAKKNSSEIDAGVISEVWTDIHEVPKFTALFARFSNSSKKAITRYNRLKTWTHRHGLELHLLGEKTVCKALNASVHSGLRVES